MAGTCESEDTSNQNDAKNPDDSQQPEHSLLNTDQWEMNSVKQVVYWAKKILVADSCLEFGIVFVTFVLNSVSACQLETTLRLG